MRCGHCGFRCRTALPRGQVSNKLRHRAVLQPLLLPWRNLPGRWPESQIADAFAVGRQLLSKLVVPTVGESFFAQGGHLVGGHVTQDFESKVTRAALVRLLRRGFGYRGGWAGSPHRFEVVADACASIRPAMIRIGSGSTKIPGFQLFLLVYDCDRYSVPLPCHCADGNTAALVTVESYEVSVLIPPVDYLRRHDSVQLHRSNLHRFSTVEIGRVFRNMELFERKIQR